jgi:hypothetical protein
VLKLPAPLQKNILKGSWRLVLSLLVSICIPASVGDLKAPHMGRRHKYIGVQPGAPRGLLTTLAKFHTSASQSSARCLTPLLRWTIALFTIFSAVTPYVMRMAELAFGRVHQTIKYCLIFNRKMGGGLILMKSGNTKNWSRSCT